MNIFDKIEKIRRQPEYIRLRWVWVFTAIGIILVIIIWIISFSSQMNNSNSEKIINDNIMTEFNTQKKSIQDTTKQMKTVLDKQPQDNIK